MRDNRKTTGRIAALHHFTASLSRLETCLWTSSITPSKEARAPLYLPDMAMLRATASFSCTFVS